MLLALASESKENPNYYSYPKARMKRVRASSEPDFSKADCIRH